MSERPHTYSYTQFMVNAVLFSEGIHRNNRYRSMRELKTGTNVSHSKTDSNFQHIGALKNSNNVLSLYFLSFKLLSLSSTYTQRVTLVSDVSDSCMLPPLVLD